MIRFKFSSTVWALKAITVLLFDMSASFTATPWPDDEWVIEIKRESAHALAGLPYRVLEPSPGTRGE